MMANANGATFGDTLKENLSALKDVDIFQPFGQGWDESSEPKNKADMAALVQRVNAYVRRRRWQQGWDPRPLLLKGDMAVCIVTDYKPPRAANFFGWGQCRCPGTRTE